MTTVTWPTIEEVRLADYEQISNWMIYLPLTETRDQAKVVREILKRYREWKKSKS